MVTGSSGWLSKDLFALQQAGITQISTRCARPPACLNWSNLPRSIRELPPTCSSSGGQRAKPHAYRRVAQRRPHPAHHRTGLNARTDSREPLPDLLGSEGRHEQTLATDQDKSASSSIRPTGMTDVRTILLLTARGSTTISMPAVLLCRGGIMASNPLVPECKRMARGARPLDLPGSPDAVLNATIFSISVPFTATHRWQRRGAVGSPSRPRTAAASSCGNPWRKMPSTTGRLRASCGTKNFPGDVAHPHTIDLCCQRRYFVQGRGTRSRARGGNRRDQYCSAAQRVGRDAGDRREQRDVWTGNRFLQLTRLSPNGANRLRRGAGQLLLDPDMLNRLETAVHSQGSPAPGKDPTDSLLRWSMSQDRASQHGMELHSRKMLVPPCRGSRNDTSSKRSLKTWHCPGQS